MNQLEQENITAVIVVVVVVVVVVRGIDMTFLQVVQHEKGHIASVTGRTMPPTVHFGAAGINSQLRDRPPTGWGVEKETI